MVALADQLAGRPLGLINPLLYQLAAQHDPGIVDVQGQGNTFRAGHVTVRGFPAGPGYDLVTGLGTIDAAKFVPDLVRLARQEAALMTARSARLALAGGCAAVLALAACSSGPSTNGLTPAAPGSSRSPRRVEPGRARGRLVRGGDPRPARRAAQDRGRAEPGPARGGLRHRSAATPGASPGRARRS